MNNIDSISKRSDVKDRPLKKRKNDFYIKTLTDIPTEVFYKIFFHLSPKDIASINSASKFLYNQSENYLSQRVRIKFEIHKKISEFQKVFNGYFNEYLNSELNFISLNACIRFIKNLTSYCKENLKSKGLAEEVFKEIRALIYPILSNSKVKVKLGSPDFTAEDRKQYFELVQYVWPSLAMLRELESWLPSSSMELSQWLNDEMKYFYVIHDECNLAPNKTALIRELHLWKDGEALFCRKNTLFNLHFVLIASSEMLKQYFIEGSGRYPNVTNTFHILEDSPFFTSIFNFYIERSDCNIRSILNEWEIFSEANLFLMNFIKDSKHLANFFVKRSSAEKRVILKFYWEYLRKLEIKQDRQIIHELLMAAYTFMKFESYDEANLLLEKAIGFYKDKKVPPHIVLLRETALYLNGNIISDNNREFIQKILLTANLNDIEARYAHKQACLTSERLNDKTI